ncbi:hypothetical protein PAP_05010 [Palaeococcus pacificus DY20341]|uniref:ABC transmembrane type-1 domain-containing protein n=1 Tax=Palaeococcus pacificus DY20341 TaxID=1343739 RepID=A0A075LXW2_9EURY|nr:ABC transporter permease subunit [Palaeococcus pacificus]AIF69413.1 hypothetical protein PAP_05010 [Palaeococcus pacificus DY20341]
MKISFELPKRKDELLKSVLMTLFALAVMAIILFPVYYMFTVSIKPSGALATSQIELIPKEITWENYKEILIGHSEVTLKTKEFSLESKSAVIKDALNRYEVIIEGGTITGKPTLSARFNLINVKILEKKGGEETTESGETRIVNGEYAKLEADEIAASTAVKNLQVKAQKIVIKVSNIQDAPVDLSMFEKTGEDTYEAKNIEITLKDGGKISAKDGTIEIHNFAYIILKKIGGQALDYMKRSLILATLTVILTLLFVIPAAYAFSRLQFFGREHVLYFYLMFTQVAGGLGIAGLVALYGMLVKLHLTNNLYILPFIYAAGGVPFNTWLLKSYLDSISPDFDEAALVDGASYLQIIRHVLIPMALPGLATVAIFAFIGGWTELILANLLLNQENHPLTVWIYTMLSNLRAVSWNQFAAAALIFALPVFIMFLLAQNYVRSGLTMGGLKE